MTSEVKGDKLRKLSVVSGAIADCEKIKELRPIAPVYRRVYNDVLESIRDRDKEWHPFEEEESK